MNEEVTTETNRISNDAGAGSIVGVLCGSILGIFIGDWGLGMLVGAGVGLVFGPGVGLMLRATPDTQGNTDSNAVAIDSDKDRS